MRPYGSPGIARHACQQEDGIETVSALAVFGSRRCISFEKTDVIFVIQKRPRVVFLFQIKSKVWLGSKTLRVIWPKHHA